MRIADGAARVKIAWSEDAVLVPPAIVKPAVTLNRASLNRVPLGAEAVMNNGNALPSENEVEM